MSWRSNTKIRRSNICFNLLDPGFLEDFTDIQLLRNAFFLI